MPNSKIRLYHGSSATFETKSCYCRVLRSSSPLEFSIFFRPKNTEKIMRQSYAYVANESTPPRIKLNHNIHIPSDIHTLYWYAWDNCSLSFFTTVWFSIKWNYFFAFRFESTVPAPWYDCEKSSHENFCSFNKDKLIMIHPVSSLLTFSHFWVGHEIRNNFANIPSSAKFILLNRSKLQGKSVEHCMLH